MLNDVSKWQRNKEGLKLQSNYKRKKVKTKKRELLQLTEVTYRSKRVKHFVDKIDRATIRRTNDELSPSS